MFRNLVARLFRKSISTPKKTSTAPTATQQLIEAQDLLRKGMSRDALPIFEDLVKSDPHNALAHNGLGVCYSEIGDSARAVHHFDIAHALDDLDPAIVANRAKMYLDSHQYAEAWQSLQNLATLGDDFPHLYAVYSGLCIALGEADKARRASLKAWLGNFQSLRTANVFLFNNSYACRSEVVLTAEHRFWAETLERPLATIPTESDGSAPSPQALEGGRIRIAYWSPDFRNHSVRYFFKPLLKAHDRSQFEIHLLHDIFTHDEHTAFFEAHCDQFHDIYSLTDAALRDYIRAQGFDILVELAGHTSANRVNLLAEKLAPVQISALGYPPTTGLNSIDFKIADPHINSPEAHRYYSEQLLPLPTSFWCFDPMEPAPLADEPPCIKNGFITFACVGNLSKISDELLQAWGNILDSVPKSRLLLRAIPFVSDYVKDHWRQRLEISGLPLSRVDLMSPLGGEHFFTSYNDIDIVLDTFPFNGGTTTSFAVYMGVPVVSISGESLLSRMGLSILSNVGLESLVATDLGTYTKKAISLAHNADRLRAIKKGLRGTMQGNALGNGQAFAAEFEQACLRALALTGERANSPSHMDQTFALPRGELASRAFKVLFAGNTEAAERINAYAVRLYGESASSLILRSMCQPNDVNLDDRETIERHLPDLEAAEQAALLLYFARRTLITRHQAHLPWALQRLETLPMTDASDRQLLSLLKATVVCQNADDAATSSVPASTNIALSPEQTDAKSLLVVMATGEPLDTNAIRDRIACTGTYNQKLQVQVECVPPTERWACITKLAAKHQYVMLVNEHVKVVQNLDLSGPLALLEEHHLLGIAGCRRWTRLSWPHDSAAQCEGSPVHLSAESAGFFDLTNLGEAFVPHASGMAMLDGALLLFRPSLLLHMPPPEHTDAGQLADAAWSAACAEQGCGLAVTNELDVVLATPAGSVNRISQQLLIERIAQERDFDLVDEGLQGKRQPPSIPCENLTMAFNLRKKCIEQNSLLSKPQGE